MKLNLFYENLLINQTQSMIVNDKDRGDKEDNEENDKMEKSKSSISPSSSIITTNKISIFISLLQSLLQLNPSHRSSCKQVLLN